MSSQVLQIIINGQDRTKEVFGGLQTNVKGLKEKLDSLGQSMQRVGSDLTKGLTLPLTAISTGAAKAAISFESAFAGVRKTVDATEAQFKKLNDGFREMAKTIPMSAVELAKIGEAAGQLGVRQESILGFTKVMAQLGVTTNLSAEEAASSLAQLANITGMSHDQFDRLGSAVVALGNDGASTEKQIVEMGLRIAGAGAQVGLAEHQILAVGAALANVGIEAEAGGTAISRTLKEMQISVSRGGESLQQFANVAGVSAARFREMFAADAASTLNTFIVGLNQMKLQGVDVISVLDEMGITEIRQSDALLRLAGNADQLTKALKVGADGWRANTALTKEAGERFKTTESQLKLLWNRVVDVGITLGNALLPHIQSAVKGLSDLIPKLESAAKWFGDLDPWVQKVVIGFAGLGIAAGPALYFFGAMAGAVTNLIGLFKALVALQVGAWLTSLGNTIPILTARLWLLNAGFAGMWAAAGAVGVVAAISVGVGTLIRDMTSLGATLDELADKWSGLAEAQARAAGQNASVISNGKGAQGVSLGQRFADMGWTQAQIKEYLKWVDGVKRASDEVVKVHEQRGAKTRVLTEEEKKLLEKFAEDVKTAMAKLSGRDVQRDLDVMAAGIRQLGGVSKITEHELRELGPRLEEAARRGARLPQVLQDAVVAARRLIEILPSLSLGLRALTPFPGGGAGNLDVTDDGVDRRQLRPRVPPPVHVDFSQPIEAARTAAQRMVTEFQRAAAEIGDLFSSLGQGIGGHFGSVLDSIGSAFSRLASRNVKEMSNLQKGVAAATEVVNIFFSAIQRGAQASSRDMAALGGAMSGAVSGALAGGQLFGPIGAAVGAAVGALSGAIGGLLGHSRAVAAALKEAHRELKDMREELLRSNGGMENLVRQAQLLGVEIGNAFSTSNVEEFEDFQRRLERAQEQQQQRMAGITRSLEGLAKYTSGLIAQMARGMTEDLRAAFGRLGDYAAATFGALIRETGNVLSALRQMGDTLDEIADAARRFGLEGSAALNELLRMHEFVSANEDLAQQIEGLIELMNGLRDAGAGTAEMFQAFGLDAVRIFTEMTARGLDARTAMILMQPILQALWERMRDFGDITDEATLALLRQAEETGIVGNNMRSVHERILQVLLAIARVLGADIPAGLDATAAAADRARQQMERLRDAAKGALAALKGIPRGGSSIPDNDRNDEDTPPPMAHGGRIPFTPGGRRVLLSEAAAENILSDEQVSGVLARAMSMMGGLRPEGGGGGGVAQPVIVQLDGRTLLSFVIPAVAEASGDGRLRTSRRSTVTRIS